jgi:hypothetical protein
MPISSSTTVTVAAQDPLSLEVSATVQPPVAVGEEDGSGRLVHPTLGVYDYEYPPTDTEGFDGDVCVGPIWTHTPTLEGAIDAMWPGHIRDALVLERWMAGITNKGDEGGIGPPISVLRALWAFFANPPADPIANPVIWSPTYATTRSYRVVIVGVRSGGEGYRVDRQLLRLFDHAPPPVELVLRVLGYAD